MKIGDRIRITDGGVYLGRWLEPGSEGVIVQEDGSTVQAAMDDGGVYTLARAEYAIITQKEGLLK